ncbi:7499_t:CDS:2 [Entrophospora sp. SA101]|nr:7499_t:CDS:2 [Entrophospora sp. SA101]
MSRIHGMFPTSHKSVVLGFISVRHIILDNDAYYYQSIDQDIQVHLVEFFLENKRRKDRIYKAAHTKSIKQGWLRGGDPL